MMADTVLGKQLAEIIQPVIDEWMAHPASEVMPSTDLTNKIVEALLPVEMYNAGYKAGRKAFADLMHEMIKDWE